jgi:hypothetical protein
MSGNHDWRRRNKKNGSRHCKISFVSHSLKCGGNERCTLLKHYFSKRSSQIEFYPLLLRVEWARCTFWRVLIVTSVVVVDQWNERFSFLYWFFFVNFFPICLD